MDVREVAEKLRLELTCSICLDFLTQAGTLDCGHSFCIKCVLQCWQETCVPWTCPLCKRSSRSRSLEPTQVLQDLVSFSRHLRPVGPGDRGSRAICGRHLAICKLYCEDDRSPLCVSCILSPEHAAHQVYPIEESAENYKKQLQEARDRAWAKEREAHMLLEQQRGRWLRYRMETRTLKRVILPEYIKTNPVWTEKKQQALWYKEKRRNVERLRAIEDRISRYILDLRKMSQELEKTLEQPPVEMLLEGRSTMERSRELLLQCPEPAALDCTVCGTTGMRELLLAFQSHISLDPGTAHCTLILSEDLKSVRLASNWRERLLQGGVEHPLFVLGAQSFTSGSHYWEVEVQSKMEWEVGICQGPANDPGNMHGDVFSIACLNLGNHFKLWISHTMEGPEETGPLHRLGIFLHYEGGHVSFYNVTQGCLIYVLPPVTFQGPLRPFFSPGPVEKESQPSSLTICPLSPQY